MVLDFRLQVRNNLSFTRNVFHYSSRHQFWCHWIMGHWNSSVPICSMLWLAFFIRVVNCSDGKGCHRPAYTTSISTTLTSELCMRVLKVTAPFLVLYTLVSDAWWHQHPWALQHTSFNQTSWGRRILVYNICFFFSVCLPEKVVLPFFTKMNHSGDSAQMYFLDVGLVYLLVYLMISSRPGYVCFSGYILRGLNNAGTISCITNSR